MSHPTAASEGRRPNRLIHEKSPYLLQHAYNPVDWYAWTTEAFEAARRENKPIFLSIGYSTCHWCHVMERESFEDADVAAAMNAAFISIKVDREERPDIDNVFMRTCQMLTGSGGWPLTIVMTPEKKPFFAGTYIPKGERFGQLGMLALIPRIQEAWTAQREDVEKSADEIIAALKKSDRMPESRALDASILTAAFEEMAGRFDEQHGGFGQAPKFPTPHALTFLIHYGQRSLDPHALEMAERTLAAMRRGGIYDQVGFGLHRYSTDSEWLAPHFEKMLYDQALLVMANAEAFEATRKPEYAKTAREVLGYMALQMTSPEGAFYSAEDADSEGEEGKFYLWREDEIKRVLTRTEAALVTLAFNVDPEGNFIEHGRSGPRGGNILHLTSEPREIAARAGISEKDFDNVWQAAREKLFIRREERVHPLKDDKILTDWNGLAIAALARAAQALDEPRYAAAAQAAADFILRTMRLPDGGLLHRYREGQAAAAGHLDDYAFMTWGLIELYQAVFDPQHLEAALALNDTMLENFWDDERGGFYFTGKNQEEVLIRNKEIYDGAVPSGNSVALSNLLRLSHLTGRPELTERASQLASAFAGALRQAPSAYTQWMTGIDFAEGPSYEVVICGNPAAADTQAMLRALRSIYLPRKVILLRPPGEAGEKIVQLAPYTREQTSIEGKATAYVCQNHSCRLPATDVDEMLKSVADIVRR
ncbi:MAG TPA: thioredoxin domain-containing protein [Terriglobia bacterium]|nr:thioredoxin domain-containing protein [Terriglobia bacterium]